MKSIPMLAAALAFGGVMAAPPAQAIVDGVESRHLQGAVQIFNGQNLTCGGTLVARRFVVTARHCFFSSAGRRLSLRNFRVRVGDHRLGQGDQHNVCETYEKVGVSTGDGPGGQAQGAFSDILVIQLREDVNQANQIAPVGNQLPAVNDNVAVKGWGHRGDMKVATMRVQALNREIDNVPDAMDLRRGNGITQNGDSGGPVMLGNQLVGVISEFEDNPQSTLAVEVQPYHDWIEQTLHSNAC
ncbi:trypsin-like serine protease [Kibdelosporangium philippinense]